MGGLTVYQFECAVLIGLLGALITWWTLDRIGRARPELSISKPVFTALAVRMGVVVVTAALGSAGDTLRGPDDPAFLDAGLRLSEQPLTDDLWLEAFKGDLLRVVIGLQAVALGDAGGTAFRLLQAALGTLAIVAMAVAVYDTAGPRAAGLCAWLLAFEPSNVFFSTILQKEALVLLAEGLVLVGAVRAWRRLDGRAVALMGSGIGLAFAVRPYAGAFLCIASLAVVLHARLRVLPSGGRVVMLLAVAVSTAVALLLAWPSIQDQLETLQDWQEATAAQTDANLPLPPVDLTTPGGLVSGLAQRTFDYVVRPFPWQMANLEQTLGATGTLIGWAFLGWLVIAAFNHRRVVVGRWPFLYPLLLITVSYALTTANAGTGFRHRTHLLFIAIALLATLISERLPVVRPPWPFTYQRKPVATSR